MKNINNENTNEVLELVSEMFIQNILTESQALFAEKLVQRGEISAESGMGGILEATI